MLSSLECLGPKTSKFCWNIRNTFYYDQEAKICKQSLFDCLSPGNKFPNRGDCERTCFTTEEVCTLPKNPGTPFCPDTSKRFYYNPFKAECIEFTYRGCFDFFGNANNFKSQSACETQCDGIERERLTTVEATTDDKSIFDTPEWASTTEDVPSDQCSWPPTTGSCRSKKSRWSYNPDDNECEKGYKKYKGCDDDTGNSFKTKAECMTACEKKTTTTSTTEAITTPGENTTTEMITTPEETTTEKITTQSPSLNCALTPVTGSCTKKRAKRYTYNSASNTCKKYTGCIDDTGNSFPSAKECLKVCHEREEKCDGPTNKTNGCSRKKTRYFYNSDNEKCSSYKGCPEDTGNSFASKSACQNACYSHS